MARRVTSRGQVAVPRHIAELMVALVEPSLTDILCDPFCADPELLCAAARLVKANAPDMPAKAELATYFAHHMFHALAPDAESTERSIKALRQYGVGMPDIRTSNALDVANSDERTAYTVVLSAVPDGSCENPKSIAMDLRRIATTKRQPLLGLLLASAMLKPGARAAVLVPESVLTGDTKAHVAVRRHLVDDGKLQGLIRLPDAVIGGYARQASLILLLRADEARDEIWAYGVMADGYSQDRRRRPLIGDGLLGPSPAVLDADSASLNELPEVVRLWKAWVHREPSSASPRARTFARGAIVASGYRFALDQLSHAGYEPTEQRAPHEVLAELTQLEAEIFQGLRDIVARLK